MNRSQNADVLRPLLAFADVNRQSHFRASSGVSTTYLDSASIYTISAELASSIVAEQRNAEPPETIDAAHVRLELLVGCIEERVWDLELLGQDFSKNIELQKQALRDIRRSGTSIHRQIDEQIDTESDRVFRQIEKALCLVVEAPYKAKQQLEKIISDLRQLESPEPTTSSTVAHRRLCNALPVLRQLAKKENRRRLEPALEEEIHSAFRATVSETVRERVIPVWKGRIRKLSESCEEMASRASIVRNKLDSIFETLGKLLEQTTCHSTSLADSIQLVITPFAPDSIRRALSASLRCQDNDELTTAIRDRWHDRLLGMAEKMTLGIDATASITELIVALPSEVSCSELTGLVEDSISDSVTIYKQLNYEGLPYVVTELLRRAKPMVRLGAYESCEELNVLPTYSTRVTLPAPKNASDALIVAELKETFTQQDPQVEFVESDSDRELSIIRMILNYPIGLGEDNLDLLIAYKRAADRGHLPHFIDIADGSKDGRAIECFLNLAEELMED